IPEMLRPRFLIHGCNHRLVIRQHLPQTVAIDNFDVGTGGRVFRESTTYLERVYDATLLALDPTPRPQFLSDSSPPRPDVSSVLLPSFKPPRARCTLTTAHSPSASTRPLPPASPILL